MARRIKKGEWQRVRHCTNKTPGAPRGFIESVLDILPGVRSAPGAAPKAPLPGRPQCRSKTS
eukprot:2195363-Pyramimonas_sp.AAC.1